MNVLFLIIITKTHYDYSDHKAETYYFIGHIYEQKREYNLALQQYERANALYPKSIWAEKIQKRIQRVHRKQNAEQLLESIRINQR